jgi:pimeloyl-ACP methyl ester carboxylesterase
MQRFPHLNVQGPEAIAGIDAMSDARLEQLEVGDGAAARAIAVRRREGAAPGLFWFGGFRSDMTGSKAEALDAWAAKHGRACIRFDYSGHGASGGRFEDGTISRWLEEAYAVLAAYAEGPQMLVGSSMGGWLALLLARRLRERGETTRVFGMVLIAPAVDMTKDLMWDQFDEAARSALAETGFCALPSSYSGDPYIVTRALIEDGEQHLFGAHPIEAGCPVHVIQGMQDADVPWQHATALMERLAFDDAVLTLVRDGDHRLSRDEDIERLIRAVEAMIEG